LTEVFLERFEVNFEVYLNASFFVIVQLLALSTLTLFLS